MNPRSNSSVLILGRQPAIGLAELESLYGADAVHPVSTAAALVDVNPEQVNFQRLGGSIKLAKLLNRLETTNWDRIEQYLRKNIPQHLQYVPEGKFKLGLSAYGFSITAGKLNASGLTLKKVIRNTGRSVRVVPNKEPALNSAQVLHNGLTTPTGWELLLIRDGSTTIIAQTIHEQDIDAYAARDQGRPKRDARVGMLPPKLAQTIINLAAADTDPRAGKVLLDPFCGTGVIIQEAALMGFEPYGTDIDPRMIDFTDQNMLWLLDQPDSPIKHTDIDLNDSSLKFYGVETGDATEYKWDPVPDIVACEGYLGQPFSTMPSGEKLADVRNTCNLILKKFLQNIAGQIQPGTRLCLAVPAWQQKPGQFLHLPLLGSASGAGLDHLEDMGYNRLSFKHAADGDLIYARADQIVARELLVLTKR